MVAFHHAGYNFCRMHQTVRVEPEMEAGLADQVWSFDGWREPKASEMAAWDSANQLGWPVAWLP